MAARICFDTCAAVYYANGTLESDSLIDYTIYFPSVVRIEAFGYGSLNVSEELSLEILLDKEYQLDLNDEIIDKAIMLRRKYACRLGDAIIAATALVYDLELWTANVKDFAAIAGLKLYNPLEGKWVQKDGD